MKKLFLAVFVLLVLIAAGAYFFLSTVDLNQFIPVLKDQLEKKLNASIEFQNAGASTENGLSLNIQGLTIEPLEPHPAEEVLKIDEASVRFDLLEILKGRFQIGSIELVRPHITVIKTRRGEILVHGLGTSSNSGSEIATKTNTDAASLPITLLIQDIKAADANFIYQDESLSPVFRTEFSHLNLHIKNFSLNKPLSVRLAGALANDTKNFELEFQMAFPEEGKPLQFKNMELHFDLTHFNWEEIRSRLPATFHIPVGNQLEGSLEVHLPVLRFDQRGLLDIEGTLKLEEGLISLPQYPELLEDVSLETQINRAYIQINPARFRIAGGSVSASATIQGWSDMPSVTFQIETEQINMEQLYVHTPTEPSVEGLMALKIKGGFQMADGELLPQSLTGEGSLQIERPRLVNMNILQEVFQKISVIPGLMSRLNEKLPESTREKINQPDTILSPIQQPFLIKQGTLYLDQASLATDFLKLSGSAQIDWAGRFNSQSLLTLSKDISEIMIQSINEFQYLTDTDGQIQIPVTLNGAPNQIHFFPDLNYVGSKIAVVKAQEMISSFLDKKIPKRKPIEEIQAPESSSEVSEPVSVSESTPAPAKTETSPTPVTQLKKLKPLQIAELLLTPQTSSQKPVEKSSQPSSTQLSNYASNSSSGSILDELLSSALTRQKNRQTSSQG